MKGDGVMPRKKSGAKRKKKLRGPASQLAAHHSITGDRKVWSDLIGQMFGGDRDIYEECGWKKNPTAADYKDMFERDPLGFRIVTAYPDATWRIEPAVREDDKDDDTEFEAAFKKLAQDKRLWHFLHRVDVMAGVGDFAAMLLGLDDIKNGEELKNPATKATDLLYMQPYYQSVTTVEKWVDKAEDERFGLPQLYKFIAKIADKDTSLLADASRVLHVAEGTTDSDVIGMSRLQVVYNRLEDLNKILGASAEAFWKMGFPGGALIKKEDADWGNEGAMEEEMEEFYHHLSRWMKLQGVDVHEFKQQVADPKGSWDVQIAAIAAASRIPVRILLGSERGELASSQDESNWLMRVDERRKQFAGPMVLRPLIELLQAVGILPEAEFEIVWPDIELLGEKEKAEVAKIISEAMAAYVKSGADALYPPYYYLVDVLGFDEDRVDEALKDLEKMMEEEEAEAEAAMEEERKRLDEEAKRAATTGQPPPVPPGQPQPPPPPPAVEK